MRITKTQPIRRFSATDERGLARVVIEMQEFVCGDEWLPRRRSLVLENGNPVEQLKYGSLVVSTTGTKLRRLS